MRFLLDTNILIWLEEPTPTFSKDLADFVRLAQSHGHTLVYHEASLRDFARDEDIERRTRNLQRVQKYECLPHFPRCPWNAAETSDNDAVDNEILYAISLDAAHYVVTEDSDMLRKAQRGGFKKRVFAIQEVAQFLRGLYERAKVHIPNIIDAPLYSLIPELGLPFFDSLRVGYPEFDDWMRSKAKEGRHAWIHRDENEALGGLCIYAEQEGERITNDELVLDGTALKLCTFKVGEGHRGRKIGELFLKTAFHYATKNRIPYIFLTAKLGEQPRLVEMLEDFGFGHIGTWKEDAVFLKRHPVDAPAMPLPPLDYHRRFFPHYLADASIRKFIIPIQPHFHAVLFPDFIKPGVHHTPLLEIAPDNPAGNAIKLAYLCHARSKGPEPGDLLLFYRSHDLHLVTTLGVVESAEFMNDAEAIARSVRRRTVYGMDEISDLAGHGTVKVILFRAAQHFPVPVPLSKLTKYGILNGAPQTITKITHEAFLSLKDLAHA